jgi:hypothetical protein
MEVMGEQVLARNGSQVLEAVSGNDQEEFIILSVLLHDELA